MLALIGAALALLYSFGVTFDEVHLGWLAVAFIGAGIAIGWTPWRRG